MNKLQFSIVSTILTASVAFSVPTVLAGAERESAGHNRVESNSMLKVERLNVSRVDSTLHVSIDIAPKSLRPGSNREVVFTPVVRGKESADSVVLDPIVFAGRNRYFSHLRNGDIIAGEQIYRAGEKGIVEYDRYVPWANWMENCCIYMREETQNCCKPVKPLCTSPIADITTVPPLSTDAAESLGYIALTGDNTIEMEEQGRAFIDFIVNRTEIREDYRKNPIELKKITESINVIKNDPDAIITRLSIKGYASPEGSYDNNVRLAMGRTESLKEYVRKKYDFDPEIMMTSYEPEDWNGLRNWLETCSLPNRDEIIAIVDSDMAPDPKDLAIRQRFPKEYKILLDSVYPALRHSDYTIRYVIRTFADIEELLATYATAPQRLRPVDFYRVAETFPEGSAEFEEVLLQASDIYPHDEQASINAANILMRRGRMTEASEKLSHAGESGEAYFSRGMLAAINQDNERAEFFLSKAEQLGIDDALPFLERVRKNNDRQTITYLIQGQE